MKLYSDYLRIGDISDDGKVCVLDEDRLCFSIKNISRGSFGIRTISKAIIEEFVEYMMDHTDATSIQVREKLCGKSDVDKFEYGYNATIFSLANMILQKPGFTRLSKQCKAPAALTESPLFLQQIFFGAPGTGKSHYIKDEIESKKEAVIRTTFHPDTDYATFVGAYKPTMRESQPPLLSLNELKKKFAELKDSQTTYYKHKFGGLYWNSLRNLSDADLKALLVEYGESETWAVEINKTVQVGATLAQKYEEKIVYEFVPQSFLLAYVQAWKYFFKAADGEPKKQFLVIEEINRGNCAQIFGDLFQLLDRNDQGFSDYPITTDADMKRQLQKSFTGITLADCTILDNMYDESDMASMVLNGDVLLLPNNFYIWATMNTSDQSLFPIDSAFKRRWDWTYIPISDAGKAWRIQVGKDVYDWWQFLLKINAVIAEITCSEDKKLGYFFCKADANGIISAQKFVGKVIFYLWNDVFKDYDTNHRFMRDELGNKLTFDQFYQASGRKSEVVLSVVAHFLKGLGVSVLSEEDLDDDDSSSQNLGKHIKVVDPSGNVMANSNSTETFVKVIKGLNHKKIEALDIKVSGYNILSKNKYDDDKGYGKSQKEMGDGYWLMTKFNTEKKAEVLRIISDKLGLGLAITIEGA